MTATQDCQRTAGPGVETAWFYFSHRGLRGPMFCPTGVQEAAYTVVDHVLHDVAQLEECMHLRVVFCGGEKAVT